MDDVASTKGPRRILWQNVSTVLSAAVLISAEVFGAAFAGGWALANLMGLGDYAVYVQIIFFLLGIAVMTSFVRNAVRVERVGVLQSYLGFSARHANAKCFS